MKDQHKTCPSAVCEPGAKLIGIVNSAGMVDLLAKPMEVDAVFDEEARKGRQPEQRFRFANKCVQSGCKQWTPGGCGVIKKVTEILNPPENEYTLPACGIRKTCRWYFQSGKQACTVCPLIITDHQ